MENDTIYSNGICIKMIQYDITQYNTIYSNDIMLLLWNNVYNNHLKSCFSILKLCPDMT